MFSPYKHDFRSRFDMTPVLVDNIAPGRPEAGSRELSRIAAQLAAEPWLWWPHVRYETPGRYYTRVAGDESYEAWLLTWLPGQSTGLHDHGGSSGAFVVVAGTLTETTVAPGGVDEVVRRLSRPRVRTFGAEHLHDVANRGSTPAISLHVYAPALQTMRRYERIDEELRQVAEEKAGTSW
jgi:mannose-6-phosphate isomerase-like protein (cupin superfamily)